MENQSSTFGRKNSLLPRAGQTSLVAILFAALTALFVVVPQGQAEDTNPAPTAEAKTYRGTNGIGMVLKQHDNVTSHEEVVEAYETAKELGVDWTRIGVSWYHIEHDKGKYNWENLDKTVAVARKHGIKMMMQVTTAPPWATDLSELNADQRWAMGIPSDTYAPKPEHYKDYANFLATVIKRYPDVVDFEIWNEPALAGYWKESRANPLPSAEGYTNLLKVAYPAAHEARSDVNIIAGGATTLPTEEDGIRINGIEFLEDMYKAGAKDYFDSLAHHPYGIDSVDWIWNGWSYMYGLPETRDGKDKKTFHDVMKAYDDADKEIWLTETGQDTLKGKDGEATQLERYDLYLEWWPKTANVGPMIFYKLQDHEEYGHDGNKENYFGVIRKDGSWKPAADAIKAYTGGKDRKPVAGSSSSSSSAAPSSSSEASKSSEPSKSSETSTYSETSKQTTSSDAPKSSEPSKSSSTPKTTEKKSVNGSSFNKWIKNIFDFVSNFINKWISGSTNR